MEAPKVGESWLVEFGLGEEKTRKVMKVVDDHPESEIINWRCKSFDCINVRAEPVVVSGECFKEKL